MNETNQMWREVKKDRAKYKQNNRDEFMGFLKENAIPFDMLTPYQFRIGGFDIYPSNRKWHNLDSGKRGQYKDLNHLKDVLSWVT